MTLLLLAIYYFGRIYIWIIILSVILSYVMDPYHPVRQGVDNLVRPLLDPIRRVLPPLGMLDFSPLVLMLLVNFVTRLAFVLLSNV